MKQTVTESMFIDSFTGGYKDNFSYEGKKALFEYLEDYEESCDTEVELDPVGLCCEFCEYDTATDCARDMGADDDINFDLDPDDVQAYSLEWLNERTMVIEFDSGIIINCF